MRHLLLPTLVCAAVWLSPIPTWGQTKPEFETSYNKSFLKRSSFLNKPAPDVEVYDEQGNAFRLAQSRGKHTVVVFGCLT